MDKQSRLLRKFVNYARKKLFRIDIWSLPVTSVLVLYLRARQTETLLHSRGRLLALAANVRPG
jgi:hypothetical protein